MEAFNYIIDTIIAVGVLIAAIGLLLNLRAGYFSTIQKCTTEYRKIVRDIQNKNFENKLVVINDLIGLFNEQLFYCKKRYLPKQIRREWKRTMLRHLKNIDNEDIIIEKKHWKDYPNIVKYMAENGVKLKE